MRKDAPVCMKSRSGLADSSLFGISLNGNAIFPRSKVVSLEPFRNRTEWAKWGATPSFCAALFVLGLVGPS